MLRQTKDIELEKLKAVKITMAITSVSKPSEFKIEKPEYLDFKARIMELQELYPEKIYTQNQADQPIKIISLSMSTISKVHQNLWVNIMSYLDIKSISLLMCASKYLRMCANNPVISKKLYTQKERLEMVKRFYTRSKLGLDFTSIINTKFHINNLNAFNFKPLHSKEVVNIPGPNCIYNDNNNDNTGFILK